MPHFSLPDDIAPEDLLPPTPPRGKKPPLQPPSSPEAARTPAPRLGGGLLPKLSIRRYRPSEEQERVMDQLVQERLGQ